MQRSQTIFLIYRYTQKIAATKINQIVKLISFIKRLTILIYFYMSFVHAKIILSPAFVICGNPRARDADVDAIIIEESFLPSGYTIMEGHIIPDLIYI